jgi:hypothetical protein
MNRDNYLDTRHIIGYADPLFIVLLVHLSVSIYFFTRSILDE